MAVTLAQAELLSQNKLHKGIIQELIKAEPLMARIPFVEVVGNALAINREDEDNLGSAEFVAINQVLTQSEANFEQVTFALKKLIGQADVDSMLQKTRSDVNDLMAAQVKVKTKLMAHEWARAAIYGVATGSNEFNGMHSLVTSGQTVHCGSSSTEAVLTLAKLDEAVDLCTAGKPDVIVMNKKINRRLSNYLRTVGSHVTERDDYGNYWTMWNGIPIITSDFLLQTETISDSTYAAPTGGACSSAFVIHFGEGEGLVGLQNGGITTEVFDKLQEYDGMRTRIKWYVGMALYSTKSLVCIDGIKDDAVTA